MNSFICDCSPFTGISGINRPAPCLFNALGLYFRKRGEVRATSFPRPSHIVRTFSSESPQNARP